MITYLTQTRTISTTTGAVAILASVGDNPLTNGDVSRRPAASAPGPAPSGLLPQQVTVRPTNAVGRERIWCDAIR